MSSTLNENIPIISTSPLPIEKSKRGRKKQNVVIAAAGNLPIVEEVKPPPKKRGRKPKGGKIIQENIIIEHKINSEPSVILHLKCSLNDININDNDTETYPTKYKYTPSVESIQSFQFNNNSNMDNFLIQPINNDNGIEQNINNINNINNSTDRQYQSNDFQNESKINSNTLDCHGKYCSDSISSKNEIWEKLTTLKVNLHNNNIYDKRSSCFWCTYDFDNPPIFIPKHEFKNSYQVYGCFCSPECSVAHLMNEKIDTSIKFERYQLLNHIYGKVYNYSKNIKPAPDPHYLLDKFYGNLTIKEYRDLFKSDQLMIVVEKPLTHVFPELYEDNSDFILNQRTIPSNSTFKLKRKNDSSNKPSVIDTLNKKAK